MRSLSAQGILIIAFSFLIALILSILPLPSIVMLMWPQWLLLVLIYWVIALPHRVSLGIAWLLGLLLDGLYGSLLGEHALAFTIVTYLAYRLHQQIRMFPLLQQAISIFVLVLIYQLILLWIQGMLGLLTSGYFIWISAITSMLVWPWLFVMLRSYRRQFGVY